MVTGTDGWPRTSGTGSQSAAPLPAASTAPVYKQVRSSDGLPTAFAEAEVMITGAQIRAGRALLNWSTAVLSRRSHLTTFIIREAEGVDGAPSVDANALAATEVALIAGGVELIGTSGVNLREKRSVPTLIYSSGDP